MSNIDFKELLEVIDQKPLKASKKIRCPYCDKKKYLAYVNGTSTLTFDPHYTTKFFCHKCNRNFWYHVKDKYAWYCDEKANCLRGVLNCYESVCYTHKKCGGRIVPKKTKLDKSDLDKYDVNGTQVNYYTTGDYRQFYICEKCGFELEENLPGPITAKTPSIQTNWKFSGSEPLISVIGSSVTKELDNIILNDLAHNTKEVDKAILKDLKNVKK